MTPLDEDPQPPDAAHTPKVNAAQQWAEARSAFQAFGALPPDQRPRHAGLLLQPMAAWILEGIQQASRRYYLLVPGEAAFARLFAQLTSLEQLPDQSEDFLAWIETRLLRDLGALIQEAQHAPGSASEPPPALIERFNRLPFRWRALLYLFLVERQSLPDLAQQLQLPQLAAARAVRRAWHKVAGPDPPPSLPSAWQRPDALPEDP